MKMTLRFCTLCNYDRIIKTLEITKIKSQVILEYANRSLKIFYNKNKRTQSRTEYFFHFFV